MKPETYRIELFQKNSKGVFWLFNKVSSLMLLTTVTDVVTKEKTLITSANNTIPRGSYVLDYFDPFKGGHCGGPQPLQLGDEDTVYIVLSELDGTVMGTMFTNKDDFNRYVEKKGNLLVRHDGYNPDRALDLLKYM